MKRACIAVFSVLLVGCASTGNHNSTASTVQENTMIGFNAIEGKGAAQDFSQAAAALDRAAEPEKYQQRSFFADLLGQSSLSSVGGDPQAQRELGLLYQEGQGVDLDAAKAHDLYTRAAFSGDPAAQADLGILYEKGIGVVRDPVTAYAWFSLAADQKDEDGILGMKRLSNMLSPDQFTASKALHDQFSAGIH